MNEQIEAGSRLVRAKPQSREETSAQDLVELRIEVVHNREQTDFR